MVHIGNPKVVESVPVVFRDIVAYCNLNIGKQQHPQGYFGSVEGRLLDDGDGSPFFDEKCLIGGVTHKIALHHRLCIIQMLLLNEHGSHPQGHILLLESIQGTFRVNHHVILPCIGLGTEFKYFGCCSVESDNSHSGVVSFMIIFKLWRKDTMIF